MSHMSSIIHSFISQEFIVSQERKKNGVRKDWDVSSGCDVEEEAKQCHLWTMSSNRPRINKVTYIVYKEWSGRALMNEIKENNYTVKVFYIKEILHVYGYMKMILLQL
jgi:hypothetical protein